MILNDADYGAQLRERRLRWGIRQNDLACLIGSQRTTITNWESGVSRVHPEAREKIERVFRQCGEPRQEGFYWVLASGSIRWMVAFWSGKSRSWWTVGESEDMDDADLTDVLEGGIVNPYTSPEGQLYYGHMNWLPRELPPWRAPPMTRERQRAIQQD